jgi:hypothetical protein
MNASAAVASALVLCSLAASPASAMMMSSVRAVAPVNPLVVNADFVQGHEAVAGVPARQAAARAEASSVMAQRYFDVDVIVTLGALALASGAFVAVGLAGSRRRQATAPAVAPREGWREEVMLALEVDLMQFSQGLRRAA